MSEVRPFARQDREQVTALVNAHVGAVVPGVSVSVNAVMSQLEREPGEYIVDPWVAERTTLVAVERERVVAAAHLRRYADDDRVGESFRGAGEIYWLLCWRNATGAGDELAQRCIAQLDAWGAERKYAGGELPAPGVYGVPDAWRHVQAIYERAGFVHEGVVEVVLVVAVDELPNAAASPVEGVAVRRELGVNGTRFSAQLDGRQIGYIEVDTDFTSGGTLAFRRLGGHRQPLASTSSTAGKASRPGSSATQPTGSVSAMPTGCSPTPGRRRTASSASRRASAFAS